MPESPAVAKHFFTKMQELLVDTNTGENTGITAKGKEFSEIIDHSIEELKQSLGYRTDEELIAIYDKYLEHQHSLDNGATELKPEEGSAADIAGKALIAKARHASLSPEQQRAEIFANFTITYPNIILSHLAKPHSSKSTVLTETKTLGR